MEPGLGAVEGMVKTRGSGGGGVPGLGLEGGRREDGRERM